MTFIQDIYESDQIHERIFNIFREILIDSKEVLVRKTRIKW